MTQESSWQEHLTKEEQGWERALTGAMGFISPTSAQVLYSLLRRLAESREKLAVVQKFVDKIAEGHVSGTWQGRLKHDLDTILEGKADE